MKSKIYFLLAFLSWIFLQNVSPAAEVRLKNLVNIRGNRVNSVMGFGLVIGLQGTGDSKKSITTNTAAANMLSRLGMITKPDDASTGSIAAVVVTANLPAFARIGDGLDVKVSAVGDAKSLVGGQLVLTPLRAADGQIYAVAQGGVITGTASGGGASVLSNATIPGGAKVEKEFSPDIAPGGVIVLSLANPDPTTSSRIADAINSGFKGYFAKATDPVAVRVEIPELYSGRLMEFIAELENLRVSPDSKATVVINERTGTVVLGFDIPISEVSVTHGDLAISVGEEAGKDGKQQKVVSIKGSTVGDLVETMNELGVKPLDLVSILQAIHAAGALHADIKVM